jgi:hypothetical protein
VAPHHWLQKSIFDDTLALGPSQLSFGGHWSRPLRRHHNVLPPQTLGGCQRRPLRRRGRHRRPGSDGPAAGQGNGQHRGGYLYIAGQEGGRPGRRCRDFHLPRASQKVIRTRALCAKLKTC